MNVLEWVKATYVDEEFCVRKRIYCRDGFHMSVQGSRSAYCSPRDCSDWYSEMEIGFPSEKESLIMEYAESPEDPTGTVYAYVPVEIIDSVIQKHGGMDEEKTLKLK